MRSEEGSGVFSRPEEGSAERQSRLRKIAQGNRVLRAGAKEIAEIERRLIAEISKALAASGKV